MSPRLVFRTACWSAMSASHLPISSVIAPSILPCGPTSPPRWAGPVAAWLGMMGWKYQREEESAMRVRRKKSLMEQASDYVESVRPKSEDAVSSALDTAGAALADAREKAGPVIADARDSAGSALA